MDNFNGLIKVQPVKWETPNWLKKFDNWIIGFTDSDVNYLREPKSEDYENEILPPDPEALNPEYRGEDCVVGSPEKHTPQEWSQIMANLRT